jgi:hypothetical protein
MSGNLRRFVTRKAILLHVFEDLVLALAGGVQILLRISFDLRCAAPTRHNLVAQLAQPEGQFRLINGSGELLRLKEAALLQGASGPIRAFSDIENHCMSVKLRRGVAVHRARGVVLELGDDELACGFSRPIAAHAGLRISFQLIQGDTHRFAVGRAHPVIATNQRGQRNGFWRGKSRVPPGPVLDRLDCFPIWILILEGLPMLDKLLTCLRMLPFREPMEFLGSNSTRKSVFLGKLALPLALYRLSLTPITLIRRREFLAVIVFELARRESF